MIDSFTADAMKVLHDPVMQHQSIVRERCTRGVKMIWQGSLGVTASLWGGPVTTTSAAFYPPHAEYRPFTTVRSSPTYVLLHHDVVFVTSDHHPSPSVDELKILDDRLRHPLPFRIVPLLRRDTCARDMECMG